MIDVVVEIVPFVFDVSRLLPILSVGFTIKVGALAYLCPYCLFTCTLSFVLLNMAFYGHVELHERHHTGQQDIRTKICKRYELYRENVDPFSYPVT